MINIYEKNMNELNISIIAIFDTIINCKKTKYNMEYIGSFSNMNKVPINNNNNNSSIPFYTSLASSFFFHPLLPSILTIPLRGVIPLPNDTAIEAEPLWGGW